MWIGCSSKLAVRKLFFPRRHTNTAEAPGECCRCQSGSAGDQSTVHWSAIVTALDRFFFGVSVVTVAVTIGVLFPRPWAFFVLLTSGLNNRYATMDVFQLSTELILYFNYCIWTRFRFLCSTVLRIEEFMLRKTTTLCRNFRKQFSNAYSVMSQPLAAFPWVTWR